VLLELYRGSSGCTLSDQIRAQPDDIIEGDLFPLFARVTLPLLTDAAPSFYVA